MPTELVYLNRTEKPSTTHHLKSKRSTTSITETDYKTAYENLKEDYVKLHRQWQDTNKSSLSLDEVKAKYNEAVTEIRNLQGMVEKLQEHKWSTEKLNSEMKGTHVKLAKENIDMKAVHVKLASELKEVTDKLNQKLLETDLSNENAKFNKKLLLETDLSKENAKLKQLISSHEGTIEKLQASMKMNRTPQPLEKEHAHHPGASTNASKQLEAQIQELKLEKQTLAKEIHSLKGSAGEEKAILIKEKANLQKMIDSLEEKMGYMKKQHSQEVSSRLQTLQSDVDKFRAKAVAMGDKMNVHRDVLRHAHLLIGTVAAHEHSIGNAHISNELHQSRDMLSGLIEDMSG
jgi:hypothetical protein